MRCCQRRGSVGRLLGLGRECASLVARVQPTSRGLFSCQAGQPITTRIFLSVSGMSRCLSLFYASLLALHNMLLDHRCELNWPEVRRSHVPEQEAHTLRQLYKPGRILSIYVAVFQKSAKLSVELQYLLRHTVTPRSPNSW